MYILKVTWIHTGWFYLLHELDAASNLLDPSWAPARYQHMSQSRVVALAELYPLLLYWADHHKLNICHSISNLYIIPSEQTTLTLPCIVSWFSVFWLDHLCLCCCLQLVDRLCGTVQYTQEEKSFLRTRLSFLGPLLSVHPTTTSNTFEGSIKSITRRL